MDMYNANEIINQNLTSCPSGTDLLVLVHVPVAGRVTFVMKLARKEKLVQIVLANAAAKMQLCAQDSQVNVLAMRVGEVRYVTYLVPKVPSE